MASLAEGMARVVREVAAGRLVRSKLRADIKVATSDRRSDVESFLKNANSARGSATRAQAEKGREAVIALHTEITSFLLGVRTSRREAGSRQAAEAKRQTQALRSETRSTLDGHKASRTRAARVSHKEAVETKSRRHSEIKAKLDQFAGELDVLQRQRRENEAEQHKQAAAFRKDLTNGVDALRDKFAQEGRDRAAEVRTSSPLTRRIAQRDRPFGPETSKRARLEPSVRPQPPRQTKRS